MWEKIRRNMRRPVPLWARLPRSTAEVSEAHTCNVSVEFRSVSFPLSLPVIYRPTHVPGWPEGFKSEGNDKSGTEKDKNRSNGVIKHPRT